MESRRFEGRWAEETRVGARGFRLGKAPGLVVRLPAASSVGRDVSVFEVDGQTDISMKMRTTA